MDCSWRTPCLFNCLRGPPWTILLPLLSTLIKLPLSSWIKSVAPAAICQEFFLSVLHAALIGEWFTYNIIMKFHSQNLCPDINPYRINNYIETQHWFLRKIHLGLRSDKLTSPHIFQHNCHYFWLSTLIQLLKNGLIKRIICMWLMNNGVPTHFSIYL
jgi:hypothetical protein